MYACQAQSRRLRVCVCVRARTHARQGVEEESAAHVQGSGSSADRRVCPSARGILHPLHISIWVCDRIVLLLLSANDAATYSAVACSDTFYLHERH